MRKRAVVVGALASGLLVLGGQGAASANVITCRRSTGTSPGRSLMTQQLSRMAGVEP